MDQPVTDRRSDTRVWWPRNDTARATLRPGHPVRLLNVSAGGVLVQADRPLRPGARVHFHCVTELRAFALVARVLRCTVWMLDPHHGVTYRGALQFDERCDLPGEALTREGSSVPMDSLARAPIPGMRYPMVCDAEAVVPPGASK